MLSFTNIRSAEPIFWM